VRIRRVAIVFALFSAIYWQVVTWFLGIINPMTGIDILPFWLVAIINAGAAAFYAAAALIFCHRLARRVVRQAQKRS